MEIVALPGQIWRGVNVASEIDTFMYRQCNDFFKVRRTVMCIKAVQEIHAKRDAYTWKLTT